jgi:hypothetical protein
MSALRTKEKRPVKLVRYVSPFGSPACMSQENAERYLAEDQRMWVMLVEDDMLTETQRRIGVPRIGDESFRYRDLPEFREPEGDVFDLIRVLVQVTENRQKMENGGGKWVVIERDGRFAVTRPQYVIDGDDVRWRTP